MYREITSPRTGIHYTLTVDAPAREARIQWGVDTVEARVSKSGLLFACDVPTDDQGFLVMQVAAVFAADIMCQITTLSGDAVRRAYVHAVTEAFDAAQEEELGCSAADLPGLESAERVHVNELLDLVEHEGSIYGVADVHGLWAVDLTDRLAGIFG